MKRDYMYVLLNAHYTPIYIFVLFCNKGEREMNELLRKQVYKKGHSIPKLFESGASVWWQIYSLLLTVLFGTQMCAIKQFTDNPVRIRDLELNFPRSPAEIWYFMKLSH